jgi:predicted alpha/beta superfamily hydrolase
METLGIRGRDLTPTELSPEQETYGYPWEETGKAENFLNFVDKELIPYVDSHYRTVTNDRAIAGWSAGALFVLYAMFQKPGLFQRTIAISPDFEWGKTVIFDIERQYASRNTLLPSKLCVCFEAPDDSPEVWQRVENAKRFLEIITERRYTGLEAGLHIFEGEDHFSVGPMGFTRGLREIYR